jgi:hypothetical protein
MTATVPIDSLMRFLQATPEQRAAFDRFLCEQEEKWLKAEGESAPARNAASADVLADAIRAQTEELKAELKAEMREVLAEAIRLTAPAQPPVNQGEAERIFAVLQRLRSKRAGMLAPLYDVFVATVLEGRSQRAAAKSCDCSPALLSRRVGELEKEFGLPLKQLQNYAQPLLEMETAVKGQRYARKKGGAPQDEAGQYEEDDGQTPSQDDDGYLREERQDDS